MHEKNYSISWFLKKVRYFHFFLLVKTATNYAEIDRLGKLEADFDKVQSNFMKYLQYCCKTSVRNQQRKVQKNIF